MPSETPKVSPTLLWKPANVVIDELSSIENQINKPSNSFVSQNSLCSSAVEIHKWKVKNSTQSYDQLQKYLRHCTVFWHKWRVHDLVLVIPPPPLIKVASNTRPYSKLGGTTLNGREEGGQYYILQTCDQERFEARKVVFRGSVSSFLQLVVGSRSLLLSVKNFKMLYILWNNPMKLCVNKVKVNRLL